MSFAFPEEGEVGTYTPHLYDEFTSVTGWWHDNSDPTDVYTGVGDKWNANAQGTNTGVGVTGGYMSIRRATGSSSTVWAYCRSNVKINTGGAQMFYNPTSNTYAIPYSDTRWMAFLPDGELPTSGPWSTSQYVIVGSDRTWVKGSGGTEQVITHTSLGFISTNVRGFRIDGDSIHYINASGGLLGSASGVDLPSVPLVNPVWGVGFRGALAGAELRLDEVNVGSFSAVENYSFEASPSTLSVDSLTPSVEVGSVKFSAEAASVNVSSPTPGVLALWYGQRTRTAVSDEFYTPASAWGANWDTSGTTRVTGGYGEIGHGGLAWARSKNGAVGYVTAEWVSPSGYPYLYDGSVGLQSADGTQGVYVEYGKVRVEGPSSSSEYLFTRPSGGVGKVKVELDGRQLRVFLNGLSNSFVSTVLPVGVAPTLPMHLFVAPVTGVLRIDSATLTEVRRSSLREPGAATLSVSAQGHQAVIEKRVSFTAEAATLDIQAPKARKYYPMLHDDFDTGVNWWVAPSGDGAVWNGTGDAWWAHAYDSNGRVIWLQSGDIFVRYGAWVVSGGSVESEGATAMFTIDPTSNTYRNSKIGLSSLPVTEPYRPFEGGQFLLAGMSETPSESFINLYVKGPDGNVQTISNVASTLSEVRGVAIENNDAVLYIGDSLRRDVYQINSTPVLDLRFFMGNFRVDEWGPGSAHIYLSRVEFGNFPTSLVKSHVFHTAPSASVSVSSNSPQVDTLRSAYIAADTFGIHLTASGHQPRAQKNVSFSEPPFTINVRSTNNVATGNEVANINAEHVEIGIESLNAGIATGTSVALPTQHVNIDVTSLDARGGDPNKNMLFEAVESVVLAPNGAYATGGHDETMYAETISINIEVDEPSVSNMTDVLIQAAKIGVDVKLVGFYNREDDKWADFVESTIGSGDAVWHRFNEVDGSKYALDELEAAGGTYNRGSYRGTPTFGISALDNRKAVRLNGGNDSIRTGVRPEYQNESYSQEIIFRTSDTGVLMGGGRDAGRDTAIVVTDAGIEVQYFANYVLKASWSSPIKVNDGQWHQVIWFEEDPEDPGESGKWTLMIDGQVAISRSPSAGADSDNVSRADMSVIGGFGTGAKITVKNLAVDVMEFVSREWSGFSRSLGLESWSILNGFTFIKAGVSNISVASRDARGKGNRKKMLIIYAHPGGDSSSNSLNARAEWSGIRIPGIEYLYDGGRWRRYGEQSGEWNGYRTYSVEIAAPRGDMGLLAPTPDGFYIDNYSGMPRYIDLDTDLAVDVTEFDVIHVAHWPGPSWDSAHRGTTALNNVAQIGWNNRLKETYYTPAKEGLIKTLRSAVDKGVSLWIADPQQAVDMGIAKGFDTHSNMREQATGLSSAYHNEPLRLRVAELESQYAPLGPHKAVKFSKGDNYKIPMPGSSVPYDTNPERETSRFVYFITDQEHIDERDIVSTAEDFSEFETNYIGESVSWEGNYDWTSHTGAHAYNVEKRPNGLQMGSRMTMAVYDSALAQTRREGNDNVHSLRPEGLVGQVIAREQFTYMDGNVERNNPWWMNATTVLLDRGTILNGTPLGGRIFVETMDNYRPLRPQEERGGSPNFWTFNIARPHVVSDEFRNFVNGVEVGDGEASKWEFDSRRESIKFNWSKTSYWRGDNRYYVDIPISEYGDPGVVTQYYTLPFFGMNDRGLVWMGIEPEEEFGKAQVFAEAADVNVSTEGPVVQVVRHVEVTTHPAEVRLEFRKPQNIADPDVTVNTTPVRITVTGGTYQRVFEVKQVPSITVGVGEPKVAGSGEDFIVYLRNENITLYLGED